MKKPVLIFLALMCSLLSLSASARPQVGRRIVYLNSEGFVVGLQISPLCLPGKNGSNPLTAGDLTSPYWREDNTVCSGSEVVLKCTEIQQTTVCDYGEVSVGDGVYVADYNLPPDVTLNQTLSNYSGLREEIYQVGIVASEYKVLDAGGVLP